MDDEVELVRDDNGMAVIGDPAAVQRFLQSQGLSSTELDLRRLEKAAGLGSAAVQAGSDIGANAGRWVKLTKKSQKALEAFPPMTGSEPGVARAIVMSNGRTKHILEFAKSGGLLAANPAMLAGAAGIMSQLAMQQAMDDIQDYLVLLDAKVDDVLRAQKDAALADMIGAELEIDEALSLRGEVGWVSDVTWSKVQSSSTTLKAAQAYALRQLDAVVDKLGKQKALSDMAGTLTAVEPTVREWLAVLARCFQLQDAMSVLELDRVLTSTPEEIDRHRHGLALARQKRLDLITANTERLADRVALAADLANTHVLLHPFKPREIVQASERLTTEVARFHEALGVKSGRDPLEARRWREAVLAVRDDAIDAGTDGVQAAGRFGTAFLRRARNAAADVAEKVAERARVASEGEPESASKAIDQADETSGP